MSLPITAEIIDACRAAGACDEGLDWISAEPRTLAELHAHRVIWSEWLAINVPSLGEAERSELQALTGCRSWWRKGQRHRDGGPAVEYANGSRLWFCHGEFHRDDGPAIEYASGYRAWFRYGHLHRIGAPAVVHADGTCTWWIDGKHVPPPEVSR